MSRVHSSRLLVLIGGKPSRRILASIVLYSLIITRCLEAIAHSTLQRGPRYSERRCFHTSSDRLTDTPCPNYVKVISAGDAAVVYFEYKQGLPEYDQSDQFALCIS